MRSSVRSICGVLFATLLLSMNIASAEEDKASTGRILKIVGVVNVVNDKGEEREVSGSNVIITELDTVKTNAGSKAVVQFSDGALSVMDEKSSLKIEKKSWLSHLGGKIYFTFRKVFGEPRRVKFKNATIGIRGTTFIVTDDESGGGVALQEGLLDIESDGPDFEIHRKKPVDDFAAFKQEAMNSQKMMMDEFASYKKQMMKEFVEYKKSFTLQPNKVVRFDGNRVDETDMGVDDKAEFDDFESIAGDMLDEFRAKAKAHREKMEMQ